MVWLSLAPMVFFIGWLIVTTVIKRKAGFINTRLDLEHNYVVLNGLLLKREQAENLRAMTFMFSILSVGDLD